MDDHEACSEGQEGQRARGRAQAAEHSEPDERRTRLRERTTPALLLGGLTGIPPVVVLACLCSSVAYPRLKMGALVFATRFARFLVVALGGQQVLGWFSP